MILQVFETRKILLIRSVSFALLFVFCFNLFTTAFAIESSKPDELVKQITFEFSVVDYQYSFTVKNDSDLDIIKFKIADSQWNNGEEKAGSFDLQQYPVTIGESVAVPAKGTVSFSPIKKMWNDCDTLFSYVYYIEFSDGTKWGTDSPNPSMIPSFALTYETFFSTVSKTTSPTDFAFAKNTKEQGNSWLIALFILIIVIVTIILSKKTKERQKNKNRKDRNNDGPYTPISENTDNKTNGKNSIKDGGESILNYPESNSLSKGKIGEYSAYEKLDEIPGEKRLLHNVFIRKSNGNTTEIDCLLIHQTGLFVIESKNYSGYIYGSPNDAQWTQVLRKNKHYTFYNPIKQNNGHIKNLLTYLSYISQDSFRSIPVYSIITFSSSADITKVKTEELPPDVYVIHTEQLIDTIVQITNKQPPKIYTEEEIAQIHEALKPLTIVSENDIKKHNQSIY